ncbi:phosphocholine-specific phospholipase C [Oligoflexus tunisiensis]|uniref:phosphocholine-specific phospholipase C n=1 Tax=Oligoflexus tunisiensis TaxID=708132 RepID=UPI000AD72E9F|nr:phospholipase C, phosphocholine-specific [Oligoflexus tunisiensis]
MMQNNRREFLIALSGLAGAAGVAGLFPPVIQKALAVSAHRRTGTLQDVEHIVILMQENRSFDHYFGTLPGVRGFADPFPVPRPAFHTMQNKNIWLQPPAPGSTAQPALAPFHLNTERHFEYIRVEGTPHTWNNAQYAWSHGRMEEWPRHKQNHSMGYYREEDIPFQFALANAFTICDAYHCSFQGGTNPNRLFLWTGTNDPLGVGHGPAIYNEYDWFDADPGSHGGYTWITYAERLERAGISWQIYQNMGDNFTDNPLAGFRSFRDAWFQRPGYSESLRHRGVATRDLDKLADDVRDDKLPQVSWIVATAEGSEHPGPSSPAQGADYTARVLEALIANPTVWSKTVLIVNFDENDGFFDHVPPPAPPSYISWHSDPGRAVLAGASTVNTRGEYHERLPGYQNTADERALLHRPYGLGPRVPCYIVSPWSKGGWVNSEVFDHTSIIKFIEKRFGVNEPNISSWRRAVCGDLLSSFNFSRPDDQAFLLPETLERARRARALTQRTTPPVPSQLIMPVQEGGIRPSRALPYELHVISRVPDSRQVTLEFRNTGRAAAVFHVYDRLNLSAVPRRFTVEPQKSLQDRWLTTPAGDYDLWVLAPNGFHRHFTGRSGIEQQVDFEMDYDRPNDALRLLFRNSSERDHIITLTANRYESSEPVTLLIPAKSSRTLSRPLVNGPWYDDSVRLQGYPGWSRRFAGRMETGQDSTSDPAMEGEAIAEQSIG